jgi:hypothetical protein
MPHAQAPGWRQPGENVGADQEPKEVTMDEVRNGSERVMTVVHTDVPPGVNDIADEAQAAALSTALRLLQEDKTLMKQE